MTVETHQFSRVNGWSCPPHPFQFIAWFFLIYFGIVYFTTIVPGLPENWQPAGHIILGISFFIHIILHIVASSLDPADENVKKSRQNGPVKFDRTKHNHVIENMHCYICEVNVLFVATITTALLGCLVILSLCVMQVAVYYIHKDGDYGAGSKILLQFRDYNTTKQYPFEVLLQPVPDEGWISCLIVTGVLAVLALCLLGHLLLFHIYLMCKGLGTFDYIIQQREEQEEEARKKEIDMEMDSKPTESGCMSKKNKVSTLKNHNGNSDVEKGNLKRGGRTKTKNHALNTVEKFSGSSLSDSGGIPGGVLGEYERALAEAELEGGETPPPAPTPMPVATKRRHNKKSKNKSRVAITSGSDRDRENKIRRKKNKKKPKSDYQDVDEETSTSYNDWEVVRKKRSPRGQGQRSDRSQRSNSLPTDRSGNKHSSRRHSQRAFYGNDEKLNSSLDDHQRPSMSPVSDSSIQSSSDLAAAEKLPYQNRGHNVSLEVTLAPVTVHPTPRVEVKAATQAVDYNSDSADSLQEIPLDQTMAGSRYGASPRETVTRQPSLTSSRDSAYNTLNKTTAFRVNSTAKYNPDGSLDYTDGFKTLPITPVPNRKHAVPPIDLSGIQTDDESS